MNEKVNLGDEVEEQVLKGMHTLLHRQEGGYQL
jgi:hypothetical protein